MYKSILVINMLHLGDLLLSTPVLRTLRTAYPEAHIALMADAKIDELVRYNPNIDELISVDKKGRHNKLTSLISLIRDIRNRNFDLVINLHPNERSSAIAAFSGGKKIVGYSSKGFGVFFENLIKNKNFDFKVKNSADVLHQTQEHLQMLKQTLGLEKVEDRGLELWTDSASEQRADELWIKAFGENSGLTVIGLNTGASWPTKRWTTEGFARVADALLSEGYGVAIFGGSMDMENVREILGLMRHRDHAKLAIFTGKVRLLELAALVKKCAVFATNDSGPMHVAIAVRTPVVSIFGASNEAGFGPYDPNAVILKANVECRPCGVHKCEHHSCMKRISEDTVVNHIRRLASKAGPAVFFDRDGVLNVDTGYVFRKEDFTWTEGAQEAIRLCNQKGYYVFVITNQSGIARGLYHEEDVQELHRWMNQELAKIGAHIDAFYYCPHHPEEGNAPYKMLCQCRKPEPGLILQAMKEWPVSRERSFMIGDKPSDIEAAKAAHIQGLRFNGGNLTEFIKAKI